LETIAPGLRDMVDEKKRYNNYSLHTGGTEQEEMEIEAGIFNRYEGAM